MLEINFIRENKEDVINRLSVKNFEGTKLITKALDLDKKRRETQRSLEHVLAESNSLAKEIGSLYKTGETERANELKQQTTILKDKSKLLDEELGVIKGKPNEILLQVPNLPHSSVPAGKGSFDNVIEKECGNIPALGKEALPHWDLAAKYNIIDFELGNKITGSGFPVYKNKGAKLQRALINFFLDSAVQNGYTEYQPPVVVNESSAYGTGQLPDKEGQMYHLELDNLYLVPTAEVPITNIYRDVILKTGELPVKIAAYSSCFRREAGSYGKDVRGLNRLHQFDKVEIVQVQEPENSYNALEEMKNYVASLLQKLELPFRIVKLCGADLSFASAMTYDMEVFSAAQNKWLEVSSISNFETFQANRMKLRVKDNEGNIRLAHTLNGSALALPRIVAAMLENNQTAQGIKIPAALVPYTGFDMIN